MTFHRQLCSFFQATSLGDGGPRALLPASLSKNWSSLGPGRLRPRLEHPAQVVPPWTGGVSMPDLGLCHPLKMQFLHSDNELIWDTEWPSANNVPWEGWPGPRPTPSTPFLLPGVGSLSKRLSFYCCLYFIFVSLFAYFERERESESQAGSAPVSTEPSTGHQPTNHEIATRAEVRRLTD